MQPFSWRAKQIALLWLATLGVSATLLTIGFLRSPQGWDLAVGIPYPITAKVAWQALHEVFLLRPFEAAALIAVPTLALAVTLSCLAIRARRRVP